MPVPWLETSFQAIQFVMTNSRAIQLTCNWKPSSWGAWQFLNGNWALVLTKPWSTDPIVINLKVHSLMWEISNWARVELGNICTSRATSFPVDATTRFFSFVQNFKGAALSKLSVRCVSHQFFSSHRIIATCSKLNKIKYAQSLYFNNSLTTKVLLPLKWSKYDLQI